MASATSSREAPSRSSTVLFASIRSELRPSLILVSTVVMVNQGLRDRPEYRDSIRGAARAVARWLEGRPWVEVVAMLVFAMVALGPHLWTIGRGIRSVQGARLFAWMLAAAALMSLITVDSSMLAACLAVGAHVVSSLRERRIDTRVRSGIDLDEPVEDLSGDLLHRSELAHLVLAQLTSEGVRCPRVAVTGAVGSGKSSLANMVRSLGEQQGHEVVVFDSWRHSTVEETRVALQQTIAQAITRRRGTFLFPVMRSWLATLLTGVVDTYKWARALALPIEDRLAIGQRELTRAIASALPADKKLIVVVDDIERVPSELAYDLFMRTKEVFDADGLAYLYCFDPAGIGAATDGWFDRVGAHELFMKVIDYHLPLPVPSAGDLRQAGLKHLTKLGAHSDVSTFFNVFPHPLPSSPRQLKRFLYMVHAWPHGIGGTPDNLDGEALLALLLLEFYSKGALAWLSHRDEMLDDLDLGLLKKSVARRLETPSPPTPDVPWAADPIAGEAYELCRFLLGRVQLARVHVDWLCGRTDDVAAGRRKQIEQLLVHSPKVTAAAVAEALPSESGWVAFDTISSFINRYFVILAAAADAVNADVTEGVLLELLRARTAIIMRVEPPRGSPGLDRMKMLWQSFWSHRQYAFGRVAALEAEWIQIRRLLECVADDELLACRDLLTQANVSIVPSGMSNGVATVRDDIDRRLAAALAEQFRVPGWMRGLFDGVGDPARERRLLFSRQLLLLPSVRPTFERVFSDNSDVVWSNVHGYFQWLWGKLGEGDADAEHLLAESWFVHLLWTTLTRKELTGRAVTMLEGLLRRWAEDTAHAGDQLPLPPWWEKRYQQSQREWTP